MLLVLEKILESPLECKEIKPVNRKGNQSWIFIGKIDAEAEAPKLWPTDVKNWLIGKDWCWERLKTEGGDRGWDGWMASLTQHEFEPAPGVGDRPGGLACCSPWGCKESDTIDWLNWTELRSIQSIFSFVDCAFGVISKKPFSNPGLRILFKINLFFNWRIIALENFLVFCQTSAWISHSYTYIPSYLPPHPIPLDWCRAPIWVSWAIRQIPVGYLFYIW